MTSVPRLSHDDSDTNIASETAQKNTSYLTGVNGLRALGIIAVILYHLRPTSPAPRRLHRSHIVLCDFRLPCHPFASSRIGC